MPIQKKGPLIKTGISLIKTGFSGNKKIIRKATHQKTGFRLF
jgi:hypothetical protein